MDESGAVVAMVAMTDDSRRDVALLIPTSLLRRAWPTLGEPTPDILGRNPYRGLKPFQAEHREVFYGRDSYILKVNRKLDARLLVAVVGASGSGKSSLALAGVLPTRSDHGWLTADFRPRSDPFRELAVGLMSYLEPEVTAPGLVWNAAEKYSEKFRHGGEELVSLTRLVLNKTKHRGFVVLADQFEELFTQTQDQDRISFIGLLTDVCANPQSPIRWLLTLRADFMEEALKDTRLIRLLQDADVMLGPMEDRELSDAIILPAKAQRVRFAPGLAERLIKDAVSPASNSVQVGVWEGVERPADPGQSRQAGRLPLLEFALEQLWNRQQGGEISHTAYDDHVLGIGGLDGALRRHAQTVYQELGAGSGGSTRQARVRARFNVIIPAHRRCGDDVHRAVLVSGEAKRTIRMTRWRSQQMMLLSDNWRFPPGEAMVEVVHEELLRAWPELQQWVSENREFDTWREELGGGSSKMAERRREREAGPPFARHTARQSTNLFSRADRPAKPCRA